MPTNLRSLSLSSTLAVAGATTLATLALSGNLTLGGNSITGVSTLSGTTLQVDDVTTTETLTGATRIMSKSGALILERADGGGCVEIIANGTTLTVTADPITCPAPGA